MSRAAGRVGGNNPAGVGQRPWGCCGPNQWVTRLPQVAPLLGARYNDLVKALSLHSWQVSAAEAISIQGKLAAQISKVGDFATVRLVAGVDISSPSLRAGVERGAVVVLRYPELTVAEVVTVERAVTFPYVPGILSFREAPIILAALEKLTITPDLLLVDGQGLAHPRRLGLASHLGLLLDMPAIGCAKSRLIGSHAPVASEAGSWTELTDEGEVVGAALRTKDGVKPLYISIGHKIDLETAVSWVLACCKGYRLPEPTRLAHLAASGREVKVELKATPQQERLTL